MLDEMKYNTSNLRVIIFGFYRIHISIENMKLPCSSSTREAASGLSSIALFIESIRLIVLDILTNCSWYIRLSISLVKNLIFENIWNLNEKVVEIKALLKRWLSNLHCSVEVGTLLGLLYFVESVEVGLLLAEREA
jgi:hypothetical protein